ncbi:MAG: secondary thiamine-phosphate synthase enzyme YjbQ [Pseudomonadota bacterium]
MPLSEISVHTPGPGLSDVTADVAGWLREIRAGDGLLTLFIRHTSASLLIQENADPDVQRDLMDWLNRFVPQADRPEMAWIRHGAEGPDDMPAHIKAAHLPVSLSIPVASGRMVLGTWQGIYLLEHRAAPHTRRIAMSFIADSG